MLQNFIDQGCNKKNPLYNHLKKMHFDQSYSIYGIKVNTIKKRDIQKTAEILISQMNKIIIMTNEGLVFNPDEVINNKRNNEYHKFFNEDNPKEPFFCTEFEINKFNHIGYKFPLSNFTKKEPISYDMCPGEKWNQIYSKDKQDLIKGFEWINDGNNFLNDGAKLIEKSYPIETSYYVFESHPEYAIKVESIKPDTSDWIWCMYNLQGDLIRIHSFEYDMEDEIKIAKNIAYWNDYKNNKYNIASEDSLTIQYVEMILKGEMDKLRNEYLEELFTLAFIENIASEFSSSNHEKIDIRNKAQKEAINTTNNFIDAIDRDKMQKARQYVKQLEFDYRNKFNKGRCIRINDKSFCFSLVDETGKATCFFKIEYIQNGPFDFKKDIAPISTTH